MADPNHELGAPAPIVAFTSGKGGCGKTTIAVNFASVVAQSGQKVLLVDFDLANRGCSGLFSDWIKAHGAHMTATSLLRGGGGTQPVLEMKPGLFLVPASSVSEPTWNSDGIVLANLVATLRVTLQALAQQVGAACVVLDCFCGIDVLTSAAAGVADDTLLVNEPDIVTFSGALTLLNHLRASFKGAPRQPNLHFVVNRLRSNLSVRDLADLYRHSLEEAVHEIVLVHFPYHPRIFDTFGQYPLISDLLPGSLFVRKLELLSYLLFKGRAEQLLKPAVARWSKRKIRTIYFRSIDRSAVDSQFLVEKFTNFPLRLGLLLLVGFLALRTMPLSPLTAWCWLVLLAAAATVVVANSLINASWLAARLHFSLGVFRLRLGRTQKSRWQYTRFATSMSASFFTGSLMALASAALAIVLGFGVYRFVDSSFNLGITGKKSPTLHARMFDLVAPYVRTIDLRHATNTAFEFSGQASGDRIELRYPRVPEPLKTTLLVQGATFRNCSIEFFGVLENCSFVACTITGKSQVPGGLRNCMLSQCQVGGEVSFESDKITRCQISFRSLNQSFVQNTTFTDCDFTSSNMMENIDAPTIKRTVWKDSRFLDCDWPLGVLFSDHSIFLNSVLELSDRPGRSGAAHTQALFGFRDCTANGLLLHARPGIAGSVWWAGETPPPGVELAGDMHWVSAEKLQEDIDQTSFVWGLETARRHFEINREDRFSLSPGYKGRFILTGSDLVTMLILANNPRAHHEAFRLNQEIIAATEKIAATVKFFAPDDADAVKILRASGSVRSELAFQRSLDLMLQIVKSTREPNLLGFDYALSDLQRHLSDPVGNDRWALWNRYAPRLAVTEIQRKRLELIRRIATQPQRAEKLIAEWAVGTKPSELPPPR